MPTSRSHPKKPIIDKKNQHNITGTDYKTVFTFMFVFDHDVLYFVPWKCVYILFYAWKSTGYHC